MTMADSDVGDIYTDEYGKLWRVISRCYEPMVTVEEVEPSGHTSDRTGYPGVLGVAVAGGTPCRGTFIRHCKDGGGGAPMWKGFQRIFRKIVAAKSHDKETT